jgi:hypothetical protein
LAPTPRRNRGLDHQPLIHSDRDFDRLTGLQGPPFSLPWACSRARLLFKLLVPCNHAAHLPRKWSVKSLGRAQNVLRNSLGLYD